MAVCRCKRRGARGDCRVQQVYDVLRKHVWAEEERLHGACAVAREAGARVRLEETGKRADELLEVLEVREREERPAEGGVIEFCALGAAVLTP